MTSPGHEQDGVLAPCTCTTTAEAGGGCPACSPVQAVDAVPLGGHGCMHEPVDAARLQQRLVHYAHKAGASDEVVQDMLALLQSDLGAGVLALKDSQLHGVLVNDAYKLHMAAMYCEHLTGVDADFALNVRRTPIPLGVMRAEHPSLYKCLQWRVAQLRHVHPYSEAVLQAVREFHDWEVPQAMIERAQVAPVTWPDIDGNPVAIASGPIDAASNVETSCMQLVQEHTILAEVARAKAASGIASSSSSRVSANTGTGAVGAANGSSDTDTGKESNAPMFLDRTERLANSLGHLCGMVTRLNACPHTFSILLMAGRRSTDLLHLLLQNLMFMRSVRGYMGTSSVWALTLLRPLLHESMPDPGQRRHFVGRLAGTHAHEMASAVQQLLVQFDHKAGQMCGAEGPVCVTQVLSHLLFLHSNGHMDNATALPDTFTTASFLAAALAADVPQEFVEDVRQRYGWTGIAPGAKCFNLFRVWRIDSGSYPDVAEQVVSAWERRCQKLTAAGQPPLPKPQLMNSNLSQVEEIAQLAALPERLRPTSLGFGGLADGFVPFDCDVDDPTSTPANNAPASITHSASTRGPCQDAVLQPCSVVMKLVQARLSTAGSQQQQQQQPLLLLQPSAAKLGDDESLGKVQLDPRLPEPQRRALQQQLVDMARRTVVQAQRNPTTFAAAVSEVLAEGYHYVTRQGALRGSAGSAS